MPRPQYLIASVIIGKEAHRKKCFLFLEKSFFWSVFSRIQIFQKTNILYVRVCIKGNKY